MAKTSSARLIVPRQTLAECVSRHLRQDLLQLAPHPHHISPSVMYRMRATLETFPKPFTFRFFDGPDRDSAFHADKESGTIEFNLGPINGVYRRALGLPFDKETRRQAVQDALEQFLLHELYHGIQNLLPHSHVRMIAKMSSPLQIGIVDLFADRFAASARAEIECYRCGNFSEHFYLSRFLVELTLMLDLWVPHVKAPAEKQHKRLRFAGEALMAARAKHTLKFGIDARSDPLPLNTPLLPLVELADRSMAIMAFAPDPIFWLPPTDLDHKTLNAVQALLSGLDSQSAATSIKIAEALLRKFGKIGRKKV